MTERRKEAAACGNFCAGCLDYRVLAENDDALRKHVAVAISKELGQDILPGQVGCEGCWGSRHTPWAASPQCRIRQCVDIKGFATCAECTAFPCQTYSRQFASDSECAANIRAIRKFGLAAWIERQQARSDGT